jgi:hypothetical protein
LNQRSCTNRKRTSGAKARLSLAAFVAAEAATYKEPISLKPASLRQRLFKVDGASSVELFEESRRIVFYLFWVGLGELLLEHADDLLESVMAVATADDLQAGAFEFKRAFGHQ